MEQNGVITKGAVSLPQMIEKVLIQGDLAPLNPEQRIVYYKKVCETVGLNELTKPFEYLAFNGKLQLYAGKNCAEQLRKIYNISIAISGREKQGDLFIVTARAKTPDGREDESIAALDCTGLAGLNLANALMKTETKAKRRVTLSICGLGMLDATEVEDVKAVAEQPPVFIPPPDMGAIDPKEVAFEVDGEIEYLYNIEKLPNEHAKKAVEYLTHMGAKYDNDRKCWVAPERLKRLDSYQMGVGE